jgi:16S rRNA (cytosine1402-N4)-methyltransferase
LKKPHPSRRRPLRSTSPGEHRPVLLDEVLHILNPLPGQIAADCTLGWGGHSAEILKRLGPTGMLIGLDMDNENLPKVTERLQPLGFPFHLHHANFAGLDNILASHGLAGADMILADLGMSSMQVDDPQRGFSYSRDGALDMRMDRTRGRSAAQLLATIGEEELAVALQKLGDEPDAPKIAAAICNARGQAPMTTTGQLAKIILDAVGEPDWRLHPKPGQWKTHPAARTFQALRLLVNRELANLTNLLRILPNCLNPGGRVAIISFHSGEDRLVKNAFRDGQRAGNYQTISDAPIRPQFRERQANPRSRSAKLRWAQRSTTSCTAKTFRSS